MSQAAEECDFSRLSLQDKLTHKNWKARAEGYESILREGSKGSISQETISIFCHEIKSSLGDSIAPAQEKALDSFLEIWEQVKYSNSLINDICEAVAKKCFGNKQKVKEKGLQIILNIVEMEHYCHIHEPLIEHGLKNSNPKILIGTLEAYTEILLSFGQKALDLKMLITHLIKLSENRSSAVRDLCKIFIAHIYHFFGQSAKPLFGNASQRFLTEIDAEYDKIKEMSKKPKKFFRSEANDAESEGEHSEAEKNDDDSKVENSDSEKENNFDAFDLVDPENIFKKLSKTFFQDIESSQWKLRKEALDSLKEVSSVPKIEYTNEIISVFAALKIVVAKDSNLLLVPLAATCITQLLTGLRDQYKNQNELISSLQSRLKEKKPNVVSALSDTLIEAFKHSPQKSEFIELSLENVKSSPNPALKAAVLNTIAHILQEMTENVVDQNLIKSSVPTLISLSGDGSPDVRKSCFLILAIFVELNPTLQSLLKPLDDIKLSKIKECKEQITLKVKKKKSEPKPAKHPKIEKKADKPKPKVYKAKNVLPPKQEEDEQEIESVKETTKTKNEKKTAPKSNTEPKKQPSSASKVELNLADPDIIQKCDSSNMNDRMKALDNLFTTLQKEPNFTKANYFEIVEVLRRRLGESNKNIVTISLKIIDEIFKQNPAKAAKHITSLFQPMVGCFGDTKLTVRQAALNSFRTMVNVSTFECVKSDYFASALKTENKNQICLFFDWLMDLIQSLNESSLTELKKSVPALLSLLVHKNIDVRKVMSDSLEKLINVLGYEVFEKQAKKLTKSPKILEAVQKFEFADAADETHHVSRDELNFDNETRMGDNECISISNSVCSSKKAPLSHFSQYSGVNHTITSEISKKTKDTMHSKLEKILPCQITKGLFSTTQATVTRTLQTITESFNSDNPIENALLENPSIFMQFLTNTIVKTDLATFPDFAQFFREFINYLCDHNIQLTDFTCSSVIKASLKLLISNTDGAKDLAEDLIQVFGDLSRPSLVISNLLGGLISKNSALSRECLAQVNHILKSTAITIEDVFGMPKLNLRALFSHANDKSDEISSLALSIVQQIYSNCGDELFNQVKVSNDLITKIRQLPVELEERVANISLNASHQSLCSMSMMSPAEKTITRGRSSFNHYQDFAMPSQMPLMRGMSTTIGRRNSFESTNIFTATQNVNSTAQLTNFDIDSVKKPNFSASEMLKKCQDIARIASTENELTNADTKILAKLGAIFNDLVIFQDPEILNGASELCNNENFQIQLNCCKFALVAISQNLSKMPQDNNKLTDETLSFAMKIFKMSQVVQYISVPLLNSYFIDLCKLIDTSNSTIDPNFKNQLVDHMQKVFDTIKFHPNQSLIPLINVLSAGIDLSLPETLMKMVLNTILRILQQIEQMPHKIYLPSVLITINVFLRKYSLRINGHSSNSSTHPPYLMKSFKVIKYILKVFTRLFSIYLTAQLKACPADSIKEVDQYVIRLHNQSSSDGSETLSDYSTANISDLEMDSPVKRDSIQNRSNTAEISDGTDFSSRIAAVKKELCTPSKCETAVRDLWMLVRTSHARLNANELLDSVPEPVNGLLRRIYQMYEVLKPDPKKSTPYGATDYHEFYQQMDARREEQMGLVNCV